MAENYAEEIEKVTGLSTKINCEVMKNNELRFRVIGEGKESSYAYVLVAVPSDGGGWQTAHDHNHVEETWIVTQGCQVVMEEVQGGKIRIVILKKGDMYVSTIGVKHNVYVFPRTIVHTIKRTNNGSKIEDDWVAAEEFDEFTKSMDMDDFVKENNLHEYL